MSKYIANPSRRAFLASAATVPAMGRTQPTSEPKTDLHAHAWLVVSDEHGDGLWLTDRPNTNDSVIAAFTSLGDAERFLCRYVDAD
jgi:hypothetical protein